MLLLHFTSSWERSRLQVTGRAVLFGRGRSTFRKEPAGACDDANPSIRLFTCKNVGCRTCSVSNLAPAYHELSSKRGSPVPHVHTLNREVNNLEVGVATSHLPTAVIVVGMASSLNLSRPQYELPGGIKRPRTATTGLVGLWLAEHGSSTQTRQPFQTLELPFDRCRYLSLFLSSALPFQDLSVRSLHDDVPISSRILMPLIVMPQPCDWLKYAVERRCVQQTVRRILAEDEKLDKDTGGQQSEGKRLQLAIDGVRHVKLVCVVFSSSAKEERRISTVRSKTEMQQMSGYKNVFATTLFQPYGTDLR